MRARDNSSPDRDIKLLQKIEEYESKDTSGQPPPGHTRGKWVPGARTDIESGYWCNPCGRKLASRLVYNRHLLSDLHARRSIREIDDGVHLPRDIPYANRRVSARRKASFATVMTWSMARLETMFTFIAVCSFNLPNFVFPDGKIENVASFVR